MAHRSKKQGKTGLIVTIIVLALTLGIVGGIAFAQNLNKTPTTDTATQQEPAVDTPVTQPEEETPVVEKPEEPAIDPKTISTIDIEPLEVTVSYKKGIPGFEFAVKRTADGTQYVEFSASGLKGTKCTDDKGLFASIVKNPTSDEDQATIKKTTKVNEDSYGLSLTGSSCTGDTDLLKDYQEAFSEPFSMLKEMR